MTHEIMDGNMGPDKPEPEKIEGGYTVGYGDPPLAVPKRNNEELRER